ncbi:MAG: ABC transporter permease, partial [Desulfurococcaceae archaeon]
KYKFNAPWYEQFIYLVTQLLKGELEDPIRKKNIFEELTIKFAITIEVAIISFLFVIAIGIPLGIIAAAKKDTVIDFLVRVFALIGSSLPPFVLFYFLIFVFFVRYKTTPLAGIPMPSQACLVWLSTLPGSIPVIGHLVSAVGSVPLFGGMLCGEWEIVADTFRRLYLPGLALGLLSGGFVARIVRNSLLDALSSEYVLFMKARGLNRLSIWRHALKNAMVPVITVLGMIFGWLLSGTVIAEIIFNIPGMGRYMYDAISRLNFPVIIATTFVVALTYLIINLVVDILYAIIDPRVRY